MLNLNVFENIVLKCACFGKHENENDIDRNIYKISREYKISILPITPNFDIDNLYLLTDHVELWNIFVIGNDKTYILANVNDPHIKLPEAENLPNKKGQMILPSELIMVFDSIWTKTLLGKQLQFYMVWNTKLYFVNTYPFFNGKNVVIGAILFMRGFNNIPDNKIKDNIPNNKIKDTIPVRYSLDEDEDKDRDRDRDRHKPNEIIKKAKYVLKVQM